MLDMIRYLVDWPRDSKGEVIFRNTHDSLFYAALLYEMKNLAEEIEALRYLCQKHLYLELNKPDANLDLVIKLAAKHQFYRECIDAAKSLPTFKTEDVGHGPDQSIGRQFDENERTDPSA